MMEKNMERTKVEDILFLIILSVWLKQFVHIKEK